MHNDCPLQAGTAVFWSASNFMDPKFGLHLVFFGCVMFCLRLGGVLLAPPRQFVVIQTACSDCKAGVELCNKLVFSRRFAGVAM